jgi:hypothetical protein
MGRFDYWRACTSQDDKIRIVYHVVLYLLYRCTLQAIDQSILAEFEQDRIAGIVCMRPSLSSTHF